VNAIGWTPLTIAGGVYYPNLYEQYPDAEAMLKKLGASNPGTRRPIDAQPQQEGAGPQTVKADSGFWVQNAVVLGSECCVPRNQPRTPAP